MQLPTLWSIVPRYGSTSMQCALVGVSVGGVGMGGDMVWYIYHVGVVLFLSG